MFIFIDHVKEESYTATDLKALAKAVGINYHTLVYHLRDKNYHSTNYIRSSGYTLCRVVNDHLKSARNPSKYSQVKYKK
jgi:hypothetical protein